MSAALIEAVQSAVNSVVQEFDKDASVMVQFAAGEWAKIKEELAKWEAEAKAEFEPVVAPPVDPVIEPVIEPIEPIEPIIATTETPPGFGN